MKVETITSTVKKKINWLLKITVLHSAYHIYPRRCASRAAERGNFVLTVDLLF